MKLITLITFFIISHISYSQDLGVFDTIPYNDLFKFKLIDENTVVEKDDSLQALIIVFNHQLFENAKRSISNNPQLKEIKIFYGNQEFLEILSNSKLPELTHLFFERFKETVLEVPAFPNIELLTIQSSELVSLNMMNSSLDQLMVLDLQTPELKNWNTAKYFPKLELIDIVAPVLDSFPIESMPNIFQFSYECSFKALPPNICSYSELQHISFNNLVPVQIDKCFEIKVKMAYYSNITVYDRMDGKVIAEILSKDRK